MAKMEQGILGPFRGTVGTVIGYRWRDRWCMRARPRFYHDRQSAPQLAQRSRFKQMIQFASPATALLRIGLRAMATGRGLTEGNCFLRLNKDFFKGNNTLDDLHTAEVDYRRLQFSRGSLPAVQGAEYERRADGIVEVRWARGLGRGDDRVHLYAYCPAAGTGLAVAAAERGRKGARFVLPAEFAQEEVHLWLFAEGKDGVASPTTYVAAAERRAAPMEDTNTGSTSAPTAGSGGATDAVAAKATDWEQERDQPGWPRPS